jgi:hypothetical protein
MSNEYGSQPINLGKEYDRANAIRLLISGEDAKFVIQLE